MTASRWATFGVVFAAVAYSLWAVFFIYRTTFIASDGHRYFSLFDDAMISMRYAWNLSHGNGPVWNPGERVEGYTNLLMVLWMSLWTALLSKSNAVAAVQLSGIPVLLGIGLLGMLTWNELGRGGEVRAGRGFAALSFVGSILYYPLAYWTLMGMETGLLTLLLLGGTLLCLVYVRTGSRRALLGGAVALGFGFLARPDSAPTAALLLGAAGILGPGDWKKRLSASILALGVYCVLPLLQTGLRAAYYGSLVPLTYILKGTGMPFSARFDNGLRFSLLFLRQARWAYLAAVVGALLGFHRRKLFLLIPPFTLLGYQVLVGGDAWTYWRLVAPAVPYLLLLILAGIDWLLSRVNLRPTSSEPWGRVGAGACRYLPLMSAGAAGALFLAAIGVDLLSSRSPGFGYAQRYAVLGVALLLFLAMIARQDSLRLAAAAGLVLVALWSLNRTFLHEASLYRHPYMVENNRNNFDAALLIDRYTTKDATIGVLWAGTIPYYTSRYAIDFLGKSDPHIAGLPADVSGAVSWSGMYSVPGHNKYDLDYSIRRRQPTYVQRFSWGSQDLTDVFRSQYVKVSLPGPDPNFRRGDPAVRWDLIPPDKILPP